MATEGKYILEIESLSKRFAGTQALSGVHLDVGVKEIHAIVGENGAGKSTLIKTLSGVYVRDAGSIRLNGEEVEFRNPLESQRAGIVVIYQDFDLAPNLTVEENLLLGKEPAKLGFVNRRSVSELAQELLNRVELEVNPKRLVARLSAAQRQLVAIARALSLDARLLVMDEPTSALALDEIDHLLALIKHLRRDGTSVIYISHKLDEVFAIADCVTILRDGKYVATKKVSETSETEVASLMVGRDLQDLFAKVSTTRTVPLLEVRGLTGKGHFSDVQFTLYGGEILGLYGLRGAGRSELVRAIFGLDKLDAGEVYVQGNQVKFRTASDAIREKMALIPEDRKSQGLFPNMTVKENVSLVSIDKLSLRGFLSARRERTLVQDFVDRLRIRLAGLEQDMLDLSGGNQQKVILARWLSINPRILILDEPTAGIDVGAKAEIYKLMSELAKEGLGLILISSELPEMLAMSDRILVMHEGRLVAELTAAEASEERIIQSIHSSRGE